MSEPRHVLVTGANSGIGLATVLHLAERGYRVTGTVRSDAKGELVAEAANEIGVEIETQILDVTDADGCERLMNGIGPLHALVNNAGYGMTGAIEDVPDDEAHHLFETMVFGPMRLARLALPAMRSAGGGRIVNISSIMGRTTTPLTGWYQGAKHALEALSDALRMEIAQDGIAVVLIEPGGFKTNIWEDLERDIAKRSGSRYASAYERIGTLQGMASFLMGDPDQCAKVIGRAIATPLPRPRYLVGADARLASVASDLTPTIIRDRVMRLAQGL